MTTNNNPLCDVPACQVLIRHYHDPVAGVCLGIPPPSVTTNNNPDLVMSLRLDKEQAEQLRLVAEADGMPASQAVREAITEYIERRRGDREFQVRLKASIERNNEVLNRLAER